MMAGSDPADTTLAAQIAGAFKLTAVEGDLETALRAATNAGTVSPVGLAALRALRETGGGSVALLAELVATAKPPAARTEALAALAGSRDPGAVARLVELLPSLTPAHRGSALEHLAGSSAGAAALAAGLRSGAVAKSDLGLSTADKLRTLLPGDAQMAALWRELGGEGRNALRLEGGFAATQITLAGPFTVECWASLDAPLDNRDGLLGAPSRLSVNFHAGKLHVWLAGTGNIVVATRPTVPRAWTHYAITRDADSLFRLYVNGELDTTSAIVNTAVLEGLDVGRATAPKAGTAGWLAEYRVWMVARSAKDIRENFDRSFAGPVTARPPDLTQLFAGAAWGPLEGTARVMPTDDLPVLLSEAEAAAQTEKFARFRALANTRGNPEAGRELFAALCLTCHQQGGEGGTIAPPLDGLGLVGVDALLRNLLTPSAAMESAYRIFRVVTRDGRVEEGFLVEENTDTLLLRSPGAEDRRIRRADIRSSGYLMRSLMPEGLLESLGEAQVSDLFTYLKSLR